jgi:NADH:ubiquinone oxidoreductase subunit 2 (subunit N)
MFFVILFISVFFFFFIVWAVSFFFTGNSPRAYFFLCFSVIFFLIFINSVLLFLYSFSYFNSFNLSSVFLPYNQINFLFAFFFNFLIIIFSILYLFGPYNKFSTENFSGFFFYYVAFASGLVINFVDDFITFVIFSELLSISAYLLIFFNTNTPRILNSFRYLLINSIGTIFLLLSLTFAVFYFGVSNFSTLFYIFKYAPLWNNEFSVGYFLFHFFFWLSFLVKFGLFPFHFWVLPIYNNSSKFAVVFFSIFLKLPFFPILLSCVRSLSDQFTQILIVFGFISVVLSTIFLFNFFKNKQSSFNFRTIMAYSSINNFGLIFITFPSSDSVILYYVFFYITSTLLVFITYFDLAMDQNGKEIKSFNFLDNNSSYFQASIGSYNLFKLSIIALSGLPPLALFFPKFVLFSGLFESSFILYSNIFAILTIFSSFIFIFLYYKFVFTPYFYSVNTQKQYFVVFNFNYKLHYVRMFVFSFLYFTMFLSPFIFYWFFVK